MTQEEDLWEEYLETVTRPVDDPHQKIDALELPALTVLAHPDPVRVGDRAVLIDLAAGRRVAISRLEPLFAQPSGHTARALGDPRLSRTPGFLTLEPEVGILLDPGRGSSSITIDGSPLVEPRTVRHEELRSGVVLVLARHIALLLHRLEPLSPVERIPGLIGESVDLLRVHHEIRRVADLDFPVLLRGESGTGKELVARALHDAGPRCTGPYLAVNVAAIPPNLAAAELFGAAKGAYSGADRRRLGYFHRAHGGTLFLDEIGEAPPDVQVLLLRVLESGQIQPVGADVPQSVDVRVLSATDADLDAAIERGEFRSPLLHRLAGYEIALPPLRDRREDIGRLFYHFLARELRSLGERERLRAAGPDESPWIDAGLVARLAAYSWPGNVRQLKNVVRQLAVGSRGGARMELSRKIERSLATVNSPSRQIEIQSAKQRPRYRDPDQVDEMELRSVLARNRFEPAPAAKELGISRPSLYNLMARYGIRKAAEVSREEIEGCLRTYGNDLTATADHLQVSTRGLKIHMKELGLRRS